MTSTLEEVPVTEKSQRRMMTDVGLTGRFLVDRARRNGVLVSPHVIEVNLPAELRTSEYDKDCRCGIVYRVTKNGRRAAIAAGGINGGSVVCLCHGRLL